MSERSVLEELLAEQETAPDTVTRSLSSWREGLGVRIVRGVGWTFIYVGVLILGFVVHQLFITSFFAERAQNELAAEFEDRLEVEEPAQAILDPETGEVVELPADYGEAVVGEFDEFDDFLFSFEAAPDRGDPVGTIRIPEIGVNWTVVEGVRLDPDLKKGAGHYPQTPLPGQPGNAAIAGHRTTYGQPFHNLDDLAAGDRIFWDSLSGTHEYEVREVQIVDPAALWVLDDRDGAWLTLTTCHPKFSARERLIVFAEMVGGPNHQVIQRTAAAAAEATP